MGATIQVSDTTSFVYEDGRLVPVEDARTLEESKKAQRRAFSEHIMEQDEYWMYLPEMIQEREWPMFQSITNYVLDKISQYLLLKSKAAAASGGSTYTSNKELIYKDLAKDLQNSMVLQRLLSGRDLFLTAPPMSYYHHWYELVDNGEAVCIDVALSHTSSWKDSKETKKLVIRIDGEEWNVIEADEEENVYTVQWKSTEYVYRLSRMTDDDFKRMLHPQQKRLVTRSNYSWKLTRLENEDGAGNEE